MLRELAAKLVVSSLSGLLAGSTLGQAEAPANASVAGAPHLPG